MRSHRFVLVLLCGVLSLAPQLALSQTPPAFGRAFLPSTWEVFGGMSVARQFSSAGSRTSYGWYASSSEYPYKLHPRLGATIEASGNYSSEPGSGLPVVDSARTGIAQPLERMRVDPGNLSTGIYTVMGGPSVSLNRTHRWQPFGRFLMGPVIYRTASTDARGFTTVEISDHFGIAAGGGTNLPISYHLAVRGQVDWIKSWNVGQGPADILRMSFGALFKW